jgi:CS domain
MDSDDYDKLTKEEREKKDRDDRARELREQEGERGLLANWNTVMNPVGLPYRWRQELGEVSVSVSVPKGTRARDLSVTIGKKSLSIGLKGKDPIMKGELCKEIKVEDSTWTIRRRFRYWRMGKQFITVGH